MLDTILKQKFMEQFEIIYDFGILDVIKKSSFVVIPLFIYLVVTNLDHKNKKRGLLKNLLPQSDRSNSSILIIIKYASLIFFVFFISIQILKTYQTYSAINNGLKFIEGYVTNFHAMPSSGHDTERFSVNNVKFDYSDFDSTDFGYNNAKSKGGKVDEKSYIKIHYYKSKDRNVILKLEKRK